MAEAILAHLAATQSLLKRLGSVDSAVTVSNTQSIVVESMLKQVDLDIVGLAPILTATDAANFAPKDAERLKKVVADKASMGRPQVAKAEDGKPQNYEALRNFLPERVWGALASDQGPTTLFRFLKSLGLEQPSEGTYQQTAVLLLLASEGAEKALAFSGPAKK